MSSVKVTIDTYFSLGCGRCKLYATPNCKVHTWNEQLMLLRQILLKTDLKEEIKWGNPCYTFEGKNVVMIGAFKESCVLSFFKGALLKDPDGILEKPGENSQTFRMFRFKDSKKITQLKSNITSYIKEAIELEKKGVKIKYKPKPMALPDELKNKFKEDPKLKSAFEQLTPGRQRGYLIFITSAKQSSTRVSRIEKCRKFILAGKGFDGR